VREAGVRGLERENLQNLRKVVKSLLLKDRDSKVVINSRNLDKYLGVRRHTYGVAEKNNQIGQVTGLAWTEWAVNCLRLRRSYCPVKAKPPPPVSSVM